MLNWILLTVYLLLLLGVILLEQKNPTEAVMWVVILICLPYLGAVLYLIFGDTMSMKLTRYRRSRRLQPFLASGPSGNPDSPAGMSHTDHSVFRSNLLCSNVPLTSCETIQIFTDGESHYRQLFQDIAGASESIRLEYYTIHHDRVGKALAALLAEKAKEGVEVQVLCDCLANLSTPSSMFSDLTRAGGRVLRLKPFLTHYRSHRKIAVIDQEIGYIGGMNIGEQYADLAKKKTPWRDTQVRLTGPCVPELERHFSMDWLCGLPSREWRQYRLPELRTRSFSGSPCQFVTSGADSIHPNMKLCYLSMIRSAKTRIRIQSPYFVPDSSILDALLTAALSGIKVELMIPGIPSSFFLEPVTSYYVRQLLECGADIFKYKGYIHAKTMIIDDDLCCIGSVNLDIRSLLVDDEICGIFYDDSFVSLYNSQFDRDLDSCTPYTSEDDQKRTLAQRLSERFFLLFAPLM